VSDLSDRQSVAKLRGVGSRRRPADSAVRKTPGCRVRRAVGRSAPEARRRMAPGPNRSARAAEERTPERNPRKATARPSRSDGTPDGERGPGAGAGAALERRTADHRRAGAGRPVPIRHGGQGFERARMQAAGSIDLPDRRARCHHRHSIGADDGPRSARALDRLVPGPNPASARNPRRAIAGDATREEAARCRLMSRSRDIDCETGPPGRRRSDAVDRRQTIRHAGCHAG
jgi:hypothetical protein